MQLIKSITIRYLRSIHRLELDPLGALTVLSGANDVGKSNILKALNLFFNNQVDWQEPIDFYRDFSFRRLDEVRRESIKGKQFIRIDVEFIRPYRYRNSLPPTFTVTRTWLRDSLVPQEDNSLERQREALPGTMDVARRMLPRFLNRVRFEYVPAVRGRAYYEHILGNLQESLLTRQVRTDDPILTAVRELNRSMGERAAALRANFESATGIEANVSLPTEPRHLFRAFSVSTTWQNEAMKQVGEAQDLSLTLRGDGMQACYVPSLLAYIAENSTEFHIWGFEEPENSIEYNLAIDLAQRFRDDYSRLAQVFITSHSPAFVSLEGSSVVSYRIFKNEDTTDKAQLYPAGDQETLIALSDELGLFRIQAELHSQYLERRDELTANSRLIEDLRAELATSTRPVIYVEGKTDATILNTAWQKLHPRDAQPFDIKCCDPLDQTGKGGAGGTGTLAKLLGTVRADSIHIAIGIFDRDGEGCKSYNGLPAYFVENGNLEAKISQNRRAAALLLPIPAGREAYADMGNLLIEFYFDDQVLEGRTPNGYGLGFTFPELFTTVDLPGRPVVETETCDLLECRRINSGKVEFAEHVVRDLEPLNFQAFEPLFQRLQQIVAYLDARP